MSYGPTNVAAIVGTTRSFRESINHFMRKGLLSLVRLTPSFSAPLSSANIICVVLHGTLNYVLFSVLTYVCSLVAESS